MDRADIKCENLIFSDHAINQMFKRYISVVNVQAIIKFGIIITAYEPDPNVWDKDFKIKIK